MNRRSKKLDSYLGQKVVIVFWDDEEKIGMLGWQGNFDSNHPIHPFSYYLYLSDSTYYSFRKSHVKSIKGVYNEYKSH